MIVLGTGIWASRKAKREEKRCTGNRSEVTMVGGRDLNIWVSIFTMTGRITTGDHNKIMMIIVNLVLNVHDGNSFRAFILKSVASKEMLANILFEHISFFNSQQMCLQFH